MNTGILKKIVDEAHVIIQDDILNNIYVANLYKFSNNLQGKLFEYNLIERYSPIEIIENKFGSWKLINIMTIFEEDLNPTFNFFININTKKIIEVTLQNNTFLNNLKLGLKYDLILLRSFKLIEWVPVFENNYEKVTVINFDGKYAIAKTHLNEKIKICNNNEIKINYNYLGKEIYVKIIPKFFSNIINIKNNGYFYKSITCKIGNVRYANFSNKSFQIRMCDEKCVLIDTLMNDSNLSNEITFKYIPIVYTREIIKSEKGKWKLLSVIDIKDFKIYVFELKNFLYGVIIKDDPQIESLIGENFSLVYDTLKIIFNIYQKDDAEYVFESIIDNKYVFRNFTNNKYIYCFLSGLKTPSESNVGKRFNLEESSIYYCYSIEDYKSFY